MPLIRSMVQFQGASGLPDDVFVNTWHFSIIAGPVEPGDIADIGAALNRFYCGDPAGTPTPIMGYYPINALAAGLPKVTHYEVDPATGYAGSPIGYSDLLGWVPGNNQPLPTEVALCMSFHGDLTDVPEESDEDGAGPIPMTRPAARRRGRVFLGPLSIDALDPYGRPHSLLRQSVQAQGDALLTDPDLGGDIDWVVYSPTTQQSHLVVGGWVDDAFDTQRRRGVAPSSRLVFS